MLWGCTCTVAGFEHVPPREDANDRRHGGRKQGRLALTRGAAQDALDVGQKAHVQHAVRLVEHQVIDVVKAQRAATEVVQHAARRADHDVGASLQVFELASVAGAAVDGGDADALDVLRNLAQLFADLDRQLARRGEHQRLRVRQRLVDALDQWDAKRGGLTRAGLRLADDVAAVQQERNDPRLNLRWLDVAHLGNCAIDFRSQHELPEAGRYNLGAAVATAPTWPSKYRGSHHLWTAPFVTDPVRWRRGLR